MNPKACRSCQPMHVPSFGEGRQWFFCVGECDWFVFSCDSVMNFAPTKADDGTILDGDSMVVVFSQTPSVLVGTWSWDRLLA
jgi:hypothetical protein